MNRPDPSPAGKKFIAGELCLDFVNTADWHASDAPIETLRTYGDLVAWCRQAGLLDEAAAARLLKKAGRRRAEAAAVLKRAIDIREAIYAAVLSLIRRQPPSASTLQDFNREVGRAFQHLQVVCGPQGLAWSWNLGKQDLEAMLWPILRSAAGLLTSERQARIGVCADDRGCGWLFLDTTKNHSRLWCQMGDCGNRAKARRHYRRMRARRSRSGKV